MEWLLGGKRCEDRTPRSSLPVRSPMRRKLREAMVPGLRGKWGGVVGERGGERTAAFAAGCDLENDSVCTGARNVWYWFNY